MEKYVEQIRANYRKEFNVIEVNDLPLVLLTEVINQSILHGATRIKVSTDGKVFIVNDNARPYDEDDLQWMLTCHPEGMMDSTRRRMFRILDRQWPWPPYCTVNALCKEFKLIVSYGDRMRCVVCRDGIVISENTGAIALDGGNMVIMEPMITPEVDETEIIEEMLEHISGRFPQITITFRVGI